MASDSAGAPSHDLVDKVLLVRLGMIEVARHVIFPSSNIMSRNQWSGVTHQ